MAAKKEIQAVKKIYGGKKGDFDRRLADFRNVWKSGDSRKILHELIFCIFTPQSKAVNCWACVEAIIEKKLMMKASPGELLKLKEMNMVRFKNKKAVFAVEARNRFVKNGRITIREFLAGFDDVYEMREWLAKNIKGYGYKEASHFLRNIGFVDDIAILDRHILKNLKLMGVIKEVPASITPGAYLDIEKKMQKFSTKHGIPMAALDLVLWYREAGKIFK
ncbi:MAG: N-glycosylase/DNA lyase [Candidatus Goldiibacteriota bacterium]